MLPSLQPTDISSPLKWRTKTFSLMTLLRIIQLYTLYTWLLLILQFLIHLSSKYRETKKYHVISLHCIDCSNRPRFCFLLLHEFHQREKSSKWIDSPEPMPLLWCTENIFRSVNIYQCKLQYETLKVFFLVYLDNKLKPRQN